MNIVNRDYVAVKGIAISLTVNTSQPSYLTDFRG